MHNKPTHNFAEATLKSEVPVREAIITGFYSQTHNKLTYRDGFLLLYLVFEQELWLAGDINDSKKEVHHNIDEKGIEQGT